MGSISKMAVNRPVGTTMLVLIVLAFGFLSIRNIQLDMMPNMNIPIAVVSTSYSGAGPQEMENLITAPLEGVLGTVPGVSNISSTSSHGNSIVIVEFEDHIDIDVAALDMRDRVDMIRPALPSGANDPIVMKIDINAMNNMVLGVSSESGDLLALRRTVEDQVVNRLERQDGVASVSVMGGHQTEIEVVLHEERLRGHGLTESGIQQMLFMENTTTPTGAVRQGDRRLNLRVAGEFTTLEDIRNLPLNTPMGGLVFLQDVATVQEVFVEGTSAAFINGQPAVTLTVQNQSMANTVEVSDAVLRELDRLRRDFPHLDFIMLFDPGEFIRFSLNHVANAGLQGGILAVVILFVFLRNVRSTFIVAVSMPIAVVATFILMFYADLTLNFLSMGGLALGIGMLVDNCIVVIESIYRKLEEGDDPKTASIEGAREVAMSVTASTLTTVAVFLPITFAGGLAAQIFNELAMTVSFSLAASLGVSLTLIPAGCSIFIKQEDVAKAREKKNTRNIFTRFLDGFDKIFSKLEGLYQRVLVFCLNRRKTTYAAVLVVFALSGASLAFVGMEFLPNTDEGQVDIRIEMPRGTVAEETEAVALTIMEHISDIPEIDHSYVIIGGGGLFGGGQADRATVTAMMVPMAERNISSDDLANDLNSRLNLIPGANITARAVDMAMGGFGGQGVSINIMGDSLENLMQMADQFSNAIEELDVVREVSTSVDEGTPQATIRLDRIKASAFGINSAALSGVVRTAVTGTVATTYRIAGQEFDVRIRQEQGDFNYITDIENILIPTGRGSVVPLTEVADVVIEEMPISINRDNQRTFVSVTALPYNVDLGTLSTEITQRLSLIPMQENYSWEFTGAAMQMDETFADLFLALIIAIGLIYMIMAAEFESFIFPLIVMFSIPLALTGGLSGLFFTGQNLSIVAFMGLIMLTGIVVNNAIVLIDYANLLVRERGMSTWDALTTAGPVRMRPILMTTLTTILGLIPMMLSRGEGAEMMRGLGVVVGFGLALSTFITLLFIPTVYMTIDVIKEKRKMKRLAKQ